MSFHRLIARRIADGVGEQLFPGRITVENAVITEIERGDFAPELACDCFYDEQYIAAPGFIDAHGHSDISLLAMPEAQGKCAQGIAFEISGNCGLSPFPLTDRNRQHLQELYRQYHIELDWSDLTSYQQRLRRQTGNLELLPLVGHNTLRAAVAGYEKKQLSAGEKAAMQTLLEQALQQGALGLSSGLLYTPGCFADRSEIIDLLKIVARYNKIYTVHLRSEGNDLAAALSETLAAARASGLKKLHLSHLKTAGPANFHKLPVILEALQTPDIQVSGDIYCYDASMTQLSVILPPPYDQFDDVRIMEILQNDDSFRQIQQQIDRERPADYWQRVRLISTSGSFAGLCGQLLADAAGNLQLPPSELYLQILRQDAVGATGAFHTLSTENMQLLAACSRVVPGSDESARNCGMDFGCSHPRGFGNHAEYFALRRKQGAGIGRIIREMSAIPAEIFDLMQIGTIQPHRRAVFTLIDEANYHARADFAHPHELAAGAGILRFD